MLAYSAIAGMMNYMRRAVATNTASTTNTTVGNFLSDSRHSSNDPTRFGQAGPPSDAQNKANGKSSRPVEVLTYYYDSAMGSIFPKP